MYVDRVPNQPREGRTNRSVRVDNDDWDALAELAATVGTDRGWVIRQLVRWYLGKGELPQRPPQREAAQEGTINAS